MTVSIMGCAASRMTMNISIMIPKGRRNASFSFLGAAGWDLAVVGLRDQPRPSTVTQVLARSTASGSIFACAADAAARRR